MQEILLVVGTIVLLIATSMIGVTLSWMTILATGVGLVAVGALVGVPTGVYYHVKLHHALAPRGVLPPRWWWSPVRYHAQLREDERSGVMVWFYLGGAGFVLMMIGCFVTLMGVLLAE